MRTHIEYDDFGEYEESMEDLLDCCSEQEKERYRGIMERVIRKMMLMGAAVTVMFCSLEGELLKS